MLFTFNYAVEYECIEYLGDYKVVFKGTRDVARRVSDKRYTSSASCNHDLDNYLNGMRTPVEYECIEYLGDYKVVFKGTRDVARRVSDKRYTSSASCNHDLDNYLNGIKVPVEYECIEYLGDYKVVFKGTRDVARYVSNKRYTSEKYCLQDLDEYLAMHK